MENSKKVARKPPADKSSTLRTPAVETVDDSRGARARAIGRVLKGDAPGAVPDSVPGGLPEGKARKRKRKPKGGDARRYVVVLKVRAPNQLVGRGKHGAGAVREEVSLIKRHAPENSAAARTLTIPGVTLPPSKLPRNGDAADGPSKEASGVHAFLLQGPTESAPDWRSPDSDEKQAENAPYARRRTTLTNEARRRFPGLELADVVHASVGLAWTIGATSRDNADVKRRLLGILLAGQARKWPAAACEWFVGALLVAANEGKAWGAP